MTICASVAVLSRPEIAMLKAEETREAATVDGQADGTCFPSNTVRCVSALRFPDFA
jgi:hypothetical protein